MWSFRFLVKIVICLIAALSETAPLLAQSDEILPHFGPDTGFDDRAPNRKDAAFYRSFAKPVRGQIQQVSEANAWVLETDTRTKIAYPRVVRLARNGSTNEVNTALAAIHGRMIRWALESDQLVARNRGGDVQEPGSASMQTAAKVTYFSAKYLSIVELGVEKTGGIAQMPFARGVMIDIERGNVFSVKACGPDRGRPMFVFGNLLAVCTESALAAFLDLWKAHAHTLETEVPSGIVPAGLEVCRLRMLAYIDKPSIFSLYLTNAGLAVHYVWSVSNGENQCVEEEHNPFNPVIIPYRELEPLMRPGSLRDELLK